MDQCSAVRCVAEQVRTTPLIQPFANGGLLGTINGYSVCEGEGVRGGSDREGRGS